MPRISQHFNPFTKIGNPSHLLPKRFRGSTASKEKEGLAARRASISPNSLPRQEKAQTGLHTTSLKLPSFKKISNFASRSLTKIAPQGLSKQEKIHQAFLKAGYDPHGPMAEALKNSFVQQDNLKGRLKAFDAGQLNTVYRGHFKDFDGKLQERIIKFEVSYTDEASQPDFFKAVGIHGTCSQETARNLAAKALDDILGWNSIVSTEIGLVKHPQTQVYTVATAMQKATGVSGYGKSMGFQPVTEEQFQQYLQWKKELEGDPNIQNTLNSLVIQLGAYDPEDAKEILDKKGNLIGLEINKHSHAIDPHDPALKIAFLKLQLQDIIMNQGDRHLNNYFVHTTDEKNLEGKEAVLGIVGIDNDLLGGTNSEINDYQKKTDQIPKKVVCPPPQIPSSLCYEILNIPVGKFQETMQLYLGKEEAGAAVQRLDQLKEHVMKVLKNNLQYGEDSLLYNYHPTNSYWLSFLNVHFPEESSKALSLLPTQS